MEIFSFHRPDGEGDAKDDDGDEDSILCTLACFDLVIIEMMFLITSPQTKGSKFHRSAFAPLSFR